MAVEQQQHEDVQDVPSWLMTFSDVITLLMTFFILLLTFASSEPESFDRMKISLFGGGGSSGIAGKKASSLDQDSILVRKRLRSGRITQRGTEMPTIHRDPSLQSVNSGIAGLKEEEDRDLSTKHSISIPLNLLIDSDGKLTRLGKQQLRMLAQQLKIQPLDVEFLVSDAGRTQDARKLASHLYEVEAILPGRMAVGQAPETGPAGNVTIIMTLQLESDRDA